MVRPDWPQQLQSFKTLAVGYVFVLLGSLTHIAVGLYKGRRGSQSDPIVLGDAAAWVYIRSGSIAFAVGTVVGGLVPPRRPR